MILKLKIITTYISLITIISMICITVTAQELSYDQIHTVYEDFNKNYYGKTYTTDDWIYEPNIFETNPYRYDTDDEGTGPIAAEIAYEIVKCRNENATSVVIPSEIEGHKILSVDGTFTFKKNTKLEKVTFSNGIKNVDYSIFKNHKKLKKVILPTSITDISVEAFYNCEGLKKVTMPSNIAIHERAFKNCKNLKTFNYKGVSDFNDIFHPNSKKGESCIFEEAFANCVKLENIDLGKAYLIEDKAFYNCQSLKSVSIPVNTKAISYKAFDKCKSLSKVTFKNTKKAPYIGKNAFKNTKKGIKFAVKNKKIAKQLKKELKNKKSRVKNAKILIGKKVIYKNING